MKVLFTNHFHASLKKSLEKLGYICHVKSDIRQSELFSVIHKYDGLIIRGRIQVTKELLSASQLKFVARAGSGIENIDLKAAQKLGVQVFSSPSANAQAVAQHALALLLNAQRNVMRSNLEVRQGSWQRASNWGSSIQSQTVGIIGFGHTGKAFAEKLVAIGYEVLVYDKYIKKIKDKTVKQVSLQTLLKSSTVVSLHIPYSKENHHFASKKLFCKMKKRPVLINTSRGKVLRTKDLIKALDKELISFAALDVLESERLDFESFKHSDRFKNLVQRPNVLITPHIAGWTQRSYKLHAKVLFAQIKALK